MQGSGVENLLSSEDGYSCRESLIWVTIILMVILILSHLNCSVYSFLRLIVRTRLHQFIMARVIWCECQGFNWKVCICCVWFTAFSWKLLLTLWQGIVIMLISEFSGFIFTCKMFPSVFFFCFFFKCCSFFLCHCLVLMSFSLFIVLCF